MIEYLSVERAPPIQIHQQVQIVYIDDCVDMSTDNLPWPWGKGEWISPNSYLLCAIWIAIL